LFLFLGRIGQRQRGIYCIFAKFWRRNITSTIPRKAKSSNIIRKSVRQSEKALSVAVVVIFSYPEGFDGSISI